MEQTSFIDCLEELMLTSATRLPRTNADKRHQLETLLKDEQWQKMSDRAIADHCGVSAPLVGKIRSELAAAGTVNTSSERVDKKGRKIQTGNIGTKPKKSQTQTEPAPPSIKGDVLTSVKQPPIQTEVIPSVHVNDIAEPLTQLKVSPANRAARIKAEIATLQRKIVTLEAELVELEECIAVRRG